MKINMCNKLEAVYLSVIMITTIFIVIPSAVATPPEEEYRYEMDIMNSPPWPSEDTSDTIVDGDFLAASAVTLSNVPTSRWTYGCTATSAGMIFGYYDRTGYPDMYTGPANGGVCPLTDLGQGIPGNPDYPIAGSCYIIATENGLDGITTNAHVDDYWIADKQPGPDPWDGAWAEHAWGLCTADFLGTNQWKWDYDPYPANDGIIDSNIDGSTTVWYSGDSKLYDWVPAAGYGTPQTACSRGMRLFAESRGYTVETNYNQRTDNFNPGPDGFTFAEFQAEIDAGYPVLIHVTGHTMVGLGYDAATNTIYIHDTWDNNQHSMTWGGSYSGRNMRGVTVFHLGPPFNIAVTEPGWDSMQDTLDTLFWDYTVISKDVLSDYSSISSYDMIFINCASGLEAEAAEAAVTGSIEQFVNNGGFLYCSDFAFTFIEQCLPGYIDFIGYVGVGDQTVTADILDTGLADWVGSPTIDLYFDLGNWIPINSVSSDVTVYVEGDISWTGGSGVKPIVVGFDYQSGHVLFTSFHHRAQGPEAAELMRYLAVMGITEGLAGELSDSLESEGYEVKEDIRWIADKSESYSFSYEAYEGEKIKFMLNWPGSTMKLTVKNPDGSIFDEVESAVPPIGIVVPYAESEYTYIVTAVDIPYDSYPFAVAVGSQDVIPPETTKTIGDPKYMDGDYVTTSTDITLEATDIGTGVKEIHYIINSMEHIVFTDEVTFNFESEGTKILEFWAVDNSDNEETHQSQTHIVDESPPEIEFIDELIELWPPNHKYHTIEISDFVVSVTDACPGVDIEDIIITSVSSDEPENAPGEEDGETLDDIVIVDSQTVKLRAERIGEGGNGRVYTINFEVSDPLGNTAIESFKIFVRHDIKTQAIDDGPGAGYTVYP